LLIARAGGCLLLGSRSSSGLGVSLGFGVERANLQLALVLFKDALIVVFPKDLGGVLASDTSEDLFAACRWREDESASRRRDEWKARGRRRGNIPGCSSWNLVISYTSPSTIMYMSSPLLCDATSLVVNVFDMMG
jgi:hypothetical protein